MYRAAPVQGKGRALGTTRGRARVAMAEAGERPPERRPAAVIVAGPTASGKSALALDLAEAFDGLVINADSMQVYRCLRVLTSVESSTTPGAVMPLQAIWSLAGGSS